MHSVWGFIEWTGNTLIFLLAGIIIGYNIDNQEIHTSDFGYVVAIYLVLLLVRCLVIAVLYPGLSRLGLRCSAGEAKFMCWAGLRGALAIALSLIVYGEYEEIGISRDEAEHFFFYVGGIATLTLIINATTAQWVLVRLGNVCNSFFLLLIKEISRSGLLDDETEDEAQSTLAVVKESMRKSLFAEVKEFKNHSTSRFSTRKIRMAEIVKLSSLLSEYVDTSRQTDTTKLGGDASSTMIPTSVLQSHFSGKKSADRPSTVVSPVIDVNMLTYYRKMFLENIRRKYWKFIEEGRLPRGEPVTTTLLYSVDTALRRVGYQSNRDWEFLSKQMRPNPRVHFVVGAIADYIPRWYVNLN